MNLGKAIRAKRHQLGWTQGIAAQKIGIRQSYLSKLENDQFIPSDAVLAKLKSVYDLTEQELELVASHPVSTIEKAPLSMTVKHLIAAMLLLMALSLIYAAQSGLLYNHTYYTYKAKMLNKSNEQGAQPESLILSYELTDAYQGEVYLDKFAGHTYQYTLIGTRTIERKENIWLTLVSGILAILALWYLIYSWYIRGCPRQP